MRSVESVRWGHAYSPSARCVSPRGTLLELGTIEFTQDFGPVVSLTDRVRPTASANSDKVLRPQRPYSRIMSYSSLLELERKDM